MLHSKVYNEAWTPDINEAMIAGECDFFEKEIIRLCNVVVDKTKDEFEILTYDADLARLTLCLAMLDYLTRHGEVSRLLADYVNF